MLTPAGVATLNLSHMCDKSVTRPRLHVLTGPTAVGKTALALAWAEQHDAEIVNADSLCFYRGMDIGTAKPTAEEQARVPHHLIDIRPCRRGTSVADYVTAARLTIDAILSRGRNVLVVGGSGFYLQGFFTPVVDNLRITPEVRERVEALFDQEGLAGVVAALRWADPAASAHVDLANPPRAIRALERVWQTGRSLKDLRAEMDAVGTPFDHFDRRLTVLMRSPEELAERIFLRVDDMLRLGLIDEVRALRADGLEENPSAARAIGYRETLAFLDQGGRLDELAATIAQNTRQLAKKQRTWFRHQLPEHRMMHPAEVTVETLFA